jgi:hypothetical protein
VAHEAGGFRVRCDLERSPRRRQAGDTLEIYEMTSRYTRVTGASFRSVSPLARSKGARTVEAGAASSADRRKAGPAAGPPEP